MFIFKYGAEVPAARLQMVVVANSMLSVSDFFVFGVQKKNSLLKLS